MNIENKNQKSILMEDVYLCDEMIFHDLKEHYYDIDCYDGFALGKWSRDEDGTTSMSPKEVTLIYPELADVIANEELSKQVLDYCGMSGLKAEDLNFADVMLCFGEITEVVW